MIDRTPEAVLSAFSESRSRSFLVLLALITLIPLVGVPLALISAGSFGGGLPGGVALLVITGPMHVAATSFFYFDRAFWPVMRESPLRCVWSPAWLPIGLLGLGVAGMALIGPLARLLIFVFHNVWLFYHYQRQNFGLISFVSTSVGGGRLPPRVNTTLNTAALGGIVAMLGTPGFYPYADGLMGPHAYFALRIVGTAVYAASVLMMIATFWREPRLRASAWLTGALVVGMAFFLPAVAFRTSALAFLPYAIAHGAQYILMMTVVVKVAFFYPANLSFESMTKMKKVQPQLEKLKAAHKDDPAGMQQAMMRLYKEEKINPMLGCLPMLATIPVFIGLFHVLNVSIEMRHAPFFGWIRDLSARDPTTILNLFGLIPWNPSATPLIGSVLNGPLHLGAWPLLYGFTMWLTQSMSPPAADPTQQKIMMWMPIVFTFVMTQLAAGLMIYYCWSNLLTILQQYVIMRRFKVDNPIDKGIRKLTGKPNPAPG